MKILKCNKFYLLALVFIMGVFFRENVAYAATNPYPLTQDWDGDGNYEIPCTRFAWQQVYDNLGVALPAWGNAGTWLEYAKNAGISTGSVAKAGSVAVWSGDGAGHVAYVTSASGNTFTVNEGGRTDLDHTSSHGVAYGYTLTNAVGGSRPYDTGKTLVGFIYPVGRADTVAPTISNLTISDVTRDGYTIRFSVSDNVGVTSVKYPTWNCDKHKGEDAVWLDGNTIINGTTWCRVDLSKVKSGAVEGNYVTHIYAYDAAGNKTSVSTPVIYIDHTAPVIVDAEVIEKDPTGYLVQCKVTDNIGVNRVQCPTWTEKNSQDDIVNGWWENNAVKASNIGNGIYQFRVNISDHNNEYGIYHTHIYAYDNCGNASCVKLNNILLEEHTHNYVEIINKIATCTMDGEKRFTCSCGDSYEQSIPAVGHTIVTEEAVAASCTVDGKTDGSHCSVCGETLKVEETVKATGHVYVLSGTNADGTPIYRCSKCGKSIQESAAEDNKEKTELEAGGTEKDTIDEDDEGDWTEEVPDKGDVEILPSGTYMVIQSSNKVREVSLSAPALSKNGSYIIPDVVFINTREYKVTEIAPNAFKNSKKLKSVTIGKNIKRIGKNAFYGCKNLKKITIKSVVLKSVGKNAVKGIHKKAVIKCPKKQLKKYKKLFKKPAGYKKSMRIKK